MPEQVDSPQPDPAGGGTVEPQVQTDDGAEQQAVPPETGGTAAGEQAQAPQTADELLKENENLKSLYGRQSLELGELRKQHGGDTAPTTEDDLDEFWNFGDDPEATEAAQPSQTPPVQAGQPVAEAEPTTYSELLYAGRGEEAEALRQSELANVANTAARGAVANYRQLQQGREKVKDLVGGRYGQDMVRKHDEKAMEVAERTGMPYHVAFRLQASTDIIKAERAMARQQALQEATNGGKIATGGQPSGGPAPVQNPGSVLGNAIMGAQSPESAGADFAGLTPKFKK